MSGERASFNSHFWWTVLGSAAGLVAWASSAANALVDDSWAWVAVFGLLTVVLVHHLGVLARMLTNQTPYEKRRVRP